MTNEMMNEKTTEELKQILQRILEQNAYWKSCQDGSYEMALDNAGYYRILKELKERKNEST